LFEIACYRHFSTVSAVFYILYIYDHLMNLQVHVKKKPHRGKVAVIFEKSILRHSSNLLQSVWYLCCIHAEKRQL